MPDFGIFRGFNDKLFGNKLYAGQLPTQLGKIGSESFGFTGLLDTYPNAAAAYSLRKLRDLYTGSAIRVRRSSDNTEQDIGFNVSGNLDTSSLTSFCGSGNGFVTTWYDQSGNAKNATQTTAANQPQIVSNGSVLTLTGTQSANPCMRFDGNNDLLDLVSTIPISTGDKFSVFQVEKKTTSSSIGIWITSGQTGAPIGPVHYSDANIYMTTKINASNADFNYRSLSGNNYNLFGGFSLNSTSLSQISINGTLNNFTNTASENRQNSFGRIGARTSEFSNTSTQELIIYISDKLNDRIDIESNINSYYGIY